jgi:hypothetical protein
MDPRAGLDAKKKIFSCYCMEYNLIRVQAEEENVRQEIENSDLG